jgi:hypothetical protein
MNAIDRRATPRFHVQYRTMLSTSERQEGMGSLHDLSLSGCCVESRVPVQWGIPLELRIHVPGLQWPLMIDGAQIQWMQGNMFGIAFVDVKGSEHERLATVIAELAAERDRSMDQEAVGG